MNLPTAIKILESVLPKSLPNNPPNYLKAIEMGIEALKLYQFSRKVGQHIDPDLLPGETKE